MERKRFLQVLGLMPLMNLMSAVVTKGKDYVMDKCRTQRDQEGPFYKTDSPLRTIIETQGTPLTIEGRVMTGENCDRPVKDAVLDIWHCDEEGEYDMQGFKCRGQVKVASDGRYQFTTIFPPPYGGRPRHIHVKVRAPGFDELTTQIYFKGDPNLGRDFSRGAETSRRIELGANGKQQKGKFDIYL